MEWWNNGMMEYWKIVFLYLITATALAGEPVITCEPRQLRGLPGQPLQAEIVIQTDRVLPAQLRIPHIVNLYLRTVETVPIQRTKEGRYIQKRIIIWQGLEAGSITLTNLTVRFQGLEKKVPDIGIEIDAVPPAEPPDPPEVKK